MTNPYAPPKTERDNDDGRLSDPLVVELVMDARYVTDAIERTRGRDPIRKLWMIARWPCAALLLLTAAVLVFNAPFYWAFGFAAFTIGSFFAYRVDDAYYVWSLRRSGWLDANCRITMSDTGYRIEALGFDMTVPWSTFRSADIFEDGVLFFQTPRSSPWIPWSAIETEAERDRLMAFVRKTYAANHAVHWSR